MLTVLAWIGGIYLVWIILGYLGFRMMYRLTNGMVVCWDYGPRSPMTPRTGLAYTMLFGGGAFLIGLGWTFCKVIEALWKKTFSGGIDRSLAANRFFGIK